MKKILVLGASSAIAVACEKIWAQTGAQFFLVGRNQESLQAIEKQLLALGANQVKVYCQDLDILSEHATLIDAASNYLGNIDQVLIAHGVLFDQDACEGSLDLALKMIHTNGISVISLVSHLIQVFNKQGFGTVAVISSVAGDRGRQSNYIYGSSKALVSNFIEGLQHRMIDSPVKLVLIKPGPVATPMTAHLTNRKMADVDWVAGKIIQGINVQQSEIYVPGYWRWIMCLVKNLPNMIFHRLKI